MDKIKNKSMNILKLALIPVSTYLIFYILCMIRDVEGFGVGVDLVTMLRNTVYTGFIALAVSYNLTSGRFDFSIGSTLILSTIIGGMITLQFGLGPIGLVVTSLIFGAVLGAISGLTYTILGLPPMVVSLGVAMIYEAIGFRMSAGAGVKMIGRMDLLIWAKSPYIYLLMLAALIVLYILLNKTSFGYNTNSLRSGQKIAVDIGINEKKNAVICYVIGGTCMAAAGVVNLCVLGTVTPEIGLGSASYIQNAFLPMFIGGILAKYADRNIGVVIGAFTQAVIFAGIGKLGVPSAWQSVITGIIVLSFFAYSFNAYRFVEFKMFKEKKKLAMMRQA